MSCKTEIALAEIVEDLILYPRHAVDDAHVAALFHAINSGAELPPIVLDEKSKRIVDGWHRYRAWKRVRGVEGTVVVELVAYTSEAEMLRDAVARNSTHGRRLDAQDRTRSIIMLRNVGLTDEEIAETIHIPTVRVQKIALKIATVPRGSNGIPGTQKIALKRSVEHFEGRRMTKAQADAHASAPGTSYLLLARQLGDAIEHGLVNMEDERLVAALDRLRGLLNALTASV
jgi:hypothetical protein